MRICYIKVLFHYFIITGVKNIIHQTEDFIIIHYFISKKQALLQTSAVVKKKEINPEVNPILRIS